MVRIELDRTACELATGEQLAAPDAAILLAEAAGNAGAVRGNRATRREVRAVGRRRHARRRNAAGAGPGRARSCVCPTGLACAAVGQRCANHGAAPAARVDADPSALAGHTCTAAHAGLTARASTCPLTPGAAATSRRSASATAGAAEVHPTQLTLPQVHCQCRAPAQQPIGAVQLTPAPTSARQPATSAVGSSQIPQAPPAQDAPPAPIPPEPLPPIPPAPRPAVPPLLLPPLPPVPDPPGDPQPPNPANATKTQKNIPA